jgi:hypothetical protein
MRALHVLDSPKHDGSLCACSLRGSTANPCAHFRS